MAVLDQATVFDEFTNIIPADIAASLQAHVCGPQAALFRYTASTEKANALLGAYDSADRKSVV